MVPSVGGAPPVALRPLRQRDRDRWFQVRRANADYLRPWDPTPPRGAGPAPSFTRYVQDLRRQARQGRLLPFAIEWEGHLVGQMHLFGIARASELSGQAGYWVAREVRGRRIAPWALAMLIDHAFEEVGLHRVEVNVRPENVASLAVVHRLGLREEGYKLRFLHIDGQWRDHRSFAVTRDQLGPLGMQGRLAGA